MDDAYLFAVQFLDEQQVNPREVVTEMRSVPEADEAYTLSVKVNDAQ